MLWSNMAIRRPASLCLFCRCRQSAIGRRRFTNTPQQHLETAVALRPEDDGIFFNSTADIQLQKEGRLSFEALYKDREQRQEVLRKLSNPWPAVGKTGSHFTPKRNREPVEHVLPEASAAPVPHAVFRDLLLNQRMHDKQIRRVLRAQLLRCQTPKDIYRVIAVCMQSTLASRSLAILYEPIIRALYRCRNNVSDVVVLSTINVIMGRFRIAGLDVNPSFLWLGLRFAARTRSLESMKRYLRLIRETGVGISPNIFRSVIAKFSIGHRGLGEIRNGRWKRSDLLQVLKGFDDCTDLPKDQQYHLGAFLERDDWQYLHGWVAVLARCRDAKGVWDEWEHWKRSPARKRPRRLGGWGRGMNSKKRGDYWFVEQVTYSGDLERAWKVVRQSGLDVKTLKSRVKMQLLDAPEFCGQRLWEDSVRNAMIEKLDFELGKIERAFGVEWKTGELDNSAAESSGVHVLVQDQWKTLEKLSADDWKLEEDYGFPWDNGSDNVPLIPEASERALHAAEERSLAT